MSNPGKNERHVLLLRGINVGGHNRLPMKELKESLSGLGFGQVNHYIQSGNLVFTAQTEATGALELKIENEIGERFGFTVPAMVLTADEFERAVQRFPFTDDETEKSVLVFLSGDSSGDWADRAEALVRDGEQYRRIGDVAYLYCPNGLARSKAAEAVLAKPKAGLKATMRNWRTVNRVRGLLTEMSQTAN